MIPQILLFDIDGVLVKPAGYQLAMEATCRFFLRQAGLEKHAPDKDVYLGFESQKVTSEWDMVPLALLIVFDQVARLSTCPTWVNDLHSAIRWSKDLDLSTLEIDYLPAIEEMGQYIQVGMTAAEGILHAFASGQAEGLFVNLRYCGLVGSLLSTTRNMFESETTGKFQEYALGADIFAKVYLSAPEEVEDSFLLKFDEALLNPNLSRKLQEMNSETSIRSAVYTARPSLAPRGVILPKNGYSPEAELALSLVGLQDIPLIGYGKLGYLAWMRETSIPKYIKPAAGQALAAMVAAWTGQEWEALCWAADLVEGKLDHRANPLPREMDLFIFEDSPAGILGGRSAIELLDGIGISAHFHPIGIASNREKTSKLENLGARIYENINVALADVSGLRMD